MKSLLGGLCAVLLGLAGLLAPQVSKAGVVGEFTSCGFSPNPWTTPIALAGHTRVELQTLDAASLASLDALIIHSCTSGPYGGSSAVDNAVNSGMGLLIEHYGYDFPRTFGYEVNLPGQLQLDHSASLNCPNQLNVVQSSPIASGPGGALAAADMNPNGLCTIISTASIQSLPSSAVPFITDLSGSQVGAFGYEVGSGRVAYSMSQFTNFDSSQQPVRAYVANVLAWFAGPSVPSTTCASEGYKGAQLTWCKNICENGLTGKVLDTWIHRWINRYRDLPYCAVEGEGGGEGQGQ